MMSGLYRRLFSSRSFQIAATFTAVGFLLLWFADTQLVASRFAGVAELLRGLAIAILTSGIVGFTFEFFTRISFSEMIKNIVSEEVERLEHRLLGKSVEESALTTFWRPFITEECVVVIAQDEQGTEPTVRSADLLTALTIQQKLFDFFTKNIRDDDFRVRIGTVSKYKKIEKDNLPFSHANLILVGAPGANPLSNYIMAFLKDLDQTTGKVKDGYVFGIEEEKKDEYLPSPFIVPVPSDQAGLQDLVNGNVKSVYQRYLSKQIGSITEDSCLLFYGKIGLLSEPISEEIHVLIIAGHSRYSTEYGAQFVLNNEDWAKSVLDAKTSVETLIKIKTSLGTEPEIWTVHPPRPVLRQTINDNEK